MIVRWGLWILLLSSITVSTGCIFSRKLSDDSSIGYAERNPVLIREMAEYALFFSITHDSTRYFIADTLPDKVVRKKMQNIGSTVEIIYRANTRYSDMSEPTDSVVIFKFITLLGIKEIVYDFAARERTYGSTKKSDYYFVKVTDRIYYRRRPVPMM